MLPFHLQDKFYIMCRHQILDRMGLGKINVRSDHEASIEWLADRAKSATEKYVLVYCDNVAVKG